MANLYKRRRLQTESEKTMNMLSSSAICESSEIIPDLRSPVSLNSKGFSVYNSPKNDRLITPINLMSNRWSLFHDGSIDKFLDTRQLWRRCLEMSSSRKDSLSPLTPVQSKNWTRSGRPLFSSLGISPLCREMAISTPFRKSHVNSLLQLP